MCHKRDFNAMILYANMHTAHTHTVSEKVIKPKTVINRSSHARPHSTVEHAASRTIQCIEAIMHCKFLVVCWASGATRGHGGDGPRIDGGNVAAVV